jgi:hypothetical protein
MWYAANLLFESVRQPDDGAEQLWEESIRLIEASSESEATKKATQLGNVERASYQADGATVTWKFSRVERVYFIEPAALTDGTELFSRFLRQSEVNSLLTPFGDA